MTGKRRRILLGRALELGGISAAIVLAVVINVLFARHYRRWDVTSGKLYTLSPATLTTLHELPDGVSIWVLFGAGDTLAQGVKHLLVSYQAETSKLDVHYIDPDRDVAQITDLRERFHIEPGRSEERGALTEAVIIVTHGDRHWFIRPSELFEVTGGSDQTRAKPREEQALTAAIRNVLGAERARLCFTTGHGEPSLDNGTDTGLGHLKDILEKDNYEPISVDTTEPNAHAPFQGCAAALIASPRAPFSREEEARLRTYLLEGGNLFLASGPINAASPTGMQSAGLDQALLPFGIGLDDDVVFELDPRLAVPEAGNMKFLVTAHPHAVTQALVPGDEDRDPPRIQVFVSRSLHRVNDPSPAAGAPAAPVDLLTTSDKAYAVRSVAGASQWVDLPEKKPGDPEGPLVVAMASERAKVRPSAPHGPRAIVIGSGEVVLKANFRKEAGPYRGTALLVENAIAWLSSKPQVLDVPEKPDVAAGIHISADDRNEVRRYVLVFLPLAAALFGVTIALWRLGGERPRIQSTGKKRGRAKRRGADTGKTESREDKR